MADSSDCTVCCEKLNKTKRSKIKCPFCSYIVCQSCCRHYILSSFHDPHCMSCRKAWSREFLTDNLNDSFLFGDYKRLREVLLFEAQQPFLAATQLLVPYEKKRRGLGKMREQTLDEISCLRHNRAVASGFTDLRENGYEIREQHYLLELIEEKILELRQIPDTKDKDVKKFVMKCPSSSCRGFLSTRYKCGTCEVTVCPSCHEEKEDEHKCNPDTVLTVEELKKTTRNCPTCQTPIYKTSGCDQMWCIQCHTAFSWAKGTVEKGIVHNPHYFEFMRTHGNEIRNPNEMICGGLPDQRQFLHRFRSEDRMDLDHLWRKTAHYRQAILAYLPTGQENVDHQDLRLDYLMNDITELEFKQKLQKREKERNKNREYRQAIDTYVNVMEELIRQVAASHLTPLQLKFQEEELVGMLNKQIVKIMDMYKIKLRTIAVSILDFY